MWVIATNLISLTKHTTAICMKHSNTMIHDLYKCIYIGHMHFYKNFTHLFLLFYWGNNLESVSIPNVLWNTE